MVSASRRPCVVRRGVDRSVRVDGRRLTGAGLIRREEARRRWSHGDRESGGGLSLIGHRHLGRRAADRVGHDRRNLRRRCVEDRRGDSVEGDRRSAKLGTELTVARLVLDQLGRTEAGAVDDHDLARGNRIRALARGIHHRADQHGLVRRPQDADSVDKSDVMAGCPPPSADA